MRDALARDDLLQLLNLATDLNTIHELAADRPNAAESTLQTHLARWRRDIISNQLIHATIASLWITLYRGDGTQAHELASQFWRSFERSPYIHFHFLRAEMMQLVARCALAAAAQAGEPRPFLDTASRFAGRLAREGASWTDAHAESIRALVAQHRGDRPQALKRLHTSVARFEAAGMRLYAEAARRLLGLSTTGAEGLAITRQAETWFGQEGVQRPDCLAATLMPPARLS
jgi:hypothetical protein